jgi:hypothetical protein
VTYSSAVYVPHGPESDGLPVVRRLVVTWQHPTLRTIEPVGFLAFDGSTHSFCYIENALRTPDFRPLLGFPDFKTHYESVPLFPLFSQRVMDPRRPDYQRYVRRLGLEADATPWEQISRSGGRRQGDTLQLFPEPTVVQGRLSCAFLVHGVRHIPSYRLQLGDVSITTSHERLETALSQIQPGDQLSLLDDQDNPVNQRAIITAAESGVPLGWVPNLLVDDLHKLRAISTVSVSAIKVNGPDASWHLRLLAQLSADVPGDFRFFTAPMWRPLCTDPLTNA